MQSGHMHSERIDVEGLAVERWPGDGPPIVLLHAGVADRRSWRPMIEAGLPGTAVAYDRRGHGESPVAPPGYRDLDDLVAVLDAVADGPAWLVGSSMGGQLAVDAALAHPDRVAGLVLIAPYVSGVPWPDELHPATVAMGERLEAAGDDQAEMNRLECWNWLDGTLADEGRVQGPARELFLDMNAIILRNAVPSGSGVVEQDAWSRLDEIRCPVTVAWGSLDEPESVELARQVAHRLVAPTREFGGTAHLPYLEQPAALAALVREAVLREAATR